MEKDEVESSPNRPDMDRNPSPPTSDDEEGEKEDSIGSTVYSKHWFFSTLTRLIQFVTEKDKSQPAGGDDEISVELDEDMENDICKVWDMSMNEEVALFLKEFNAPEIFLGIITKSKCNRLTEICVGILGNMACFQDTCVAISKNEDLGAVLLLLMCDTDPPTLLETTRLLLTCLSQVDVMSTWLERIKKRPTVRDNLCFIMSSSTNGDLLVKVGELVDKLFDVDEELMIDWINAGCQETGTSGNDNEETPTVLGLVPSLLEAAKQLKNDSPEGLEVYMHTLQLVTTVDEGIQSIVQFQEDAKQTWEFLFDLTCRDLCQPGDPPLIIQEQKIILSSVLTVMFVMFASQTDQEYTEIRKNLALIGSLTRILENQETCQRKNQGKRIPDQAETEENVTEEDFHLKILKDVCCEFLSNILSQLTKENIVEALKAGHITEETSLCALRTLLPLYATSVNSFIVVLGEADPTLAETLKKDTNEDS
ncbi:protein SAAL1 isoform X3 [Phyllobates terribilis]|uniref:protein SAAL1 isoform X3 n=1 Tax=Phyllobates terribilis TaxID=111132 RepID=UPI003CCAD86D